MFAVLSRPMQATLATRAAKLTAETPPQWGQMTVTAMLDHLTDALRRTMRADPGLERVGQWYHRGLGKILGLYVVPWPRGVKAPPGLTVTAMAADFTVAQTNFLAILAEYVDYLDHTPTASTMHPYFGRLSHNQLRRFHWKHIDHHFRQFGV